MQIIKLHRLATLWSFQEVESTKEVACLCPILLWMKVLGEVLKPGLLHRNQTHIIDIPRIILNFAWYHHRIMSSPPGSVGGHIRPQPRPTKSCWHNSTIRADVSIILQQIHLMLKKHRCLNIRNTLSNIGYKSTLYHGDGLLANPYLSLQHRKWSMIIQLHQIERIVESERWYKE